MAKKPYSFAHFFGLGAAASSENEDDKEKNDSKGKKTEEDKPEKKENEPEKKPDANDDDEEPEAKDDDGDDDEEDEDTRQARTSERHRCARIFSSPFAAANPALASSLAFNTGMSSAMVVGILASTAPVASKPQKHKRSLDERMQEGQQVRLNPDGGKQTGKSALVSKMTSLYNSAKGDK